ncbi:hypothetical protein BGW38_005225 [Lunasporangiospora selenospora]|uniref:Receptor ligand binding region domain-containing protein n=1 Tax=Lunasporangiospora selenospora TaxID=979761 RepID=A0A9P6FP34_9FUNG|nr:hypothetical protein BGW38_005225 [Lunasporangiospora selenospora]
MREGLVEIKVGVLLPFSLPNNLTQQLAFSGTSAIRLAANNSGAAQAIFSTVSLLQSDRGVSVLVFSGFKARLTFQLSNKDDYSYFFRTIPTELMFGTVMLDFVANRGWSTVAVFYTSDSLGSGMMDNIADQARLRNITIGYHQAFWDKGANSELAPVLDGLVESGLRVILIAAVGVPQVKLMLEAVRRGLVSKDYVWLTTNQVAQPLLGEDSTMKPKDLNGLFMFDNLLKLHGYHPYEQFLDKWAALDTAEYPYAGQRDISSNEALAYSCMMVMAHGFATAVRGNWTALRHLAYGRLGSNFKPTNMNT